MPCTGPNIGIMILNHDGRKWLPALYDSLRASQGPKFRIYLVDNGSTDDSIALTREKFPEVTILSLPQNMGYCMAYNVTMPQAFKDGCDWVVWANNDTVVEPDCLAELANATASDPRIGILGPCFWGWENNEPNYYMVGKHPNAIPAMQSGSHVPMDVDWVEGSFLMVSRRCIEDVGPLDPILFFSWEETDFCRRARLHGWRVILVPRALARHYNGGSHATDLSRKTAWNRRAARNYYIYTLTNPEQSFFKNILDACHLFLVLSKAGLSAKPSSVFGELGIFAKVFSMTPAIYSKWHRDRAGGRPPLMDETWAGIPGNAGVWPTILSPGRQRSLEAQNQ